MRPRRGGLGKSFTAGPRPGSPLLAFAECCHLRACVGHAASPPVCLRLVTAENSKGEKDTFKHFDDKSGKSIVDVYNFILDSGAKTLVKCSDWSDTMPYVDKLTVGMQSKELRYFINNEAYD